MADPVICIIKKNPDGTLTWTPALDSNLKPWTSPAPEGEKKKAPKKKLPPKKKKAKTSLKITEPQPDASDAGVATLPAAEPDISDDHPSDEVTNLSKDFVVAHEDFPGPFGRSTEIFDISDGLCDEAMVHLTDISDVYEASWLDCPNDVVDDVKAVKYKPNDDKEKRFAGIGPAFTSGCRAVNRMTCAELPCANKDNMKGYMDEALDVTPACGYKVDPDAKYKLNTDLNSDCAFDLDAMYKLNIASSLGDGAPSCGGANFLDYKKDTMKDFTEHIVAEPGLGPPLPSGHNIMIEELISKRGMNKCYLSEPPFLGSLRAGLL
eukprot:TRINITY_DN42043_c0_g1_i3.p2 TRINITY_DN42043_c0_g1~~TRINITY_DN42043_c0_g1_i3.p2  ORF type:complete len:321 (-),score=88.66 TRINITY_DN42043_c0_g1_i3:695-1657(-)